MTDSPTVAGALPETVLALARQARETFGMGVKLKFAAWPGGQAGSPAFDDPGGMDARQLQSQRPPT